MSDERMAPVQSGSGSPTSIPWELHVRVWQVYAAVGHGSQSAARIAERGGFGHGEVIRMLAGYNITGRNEWEPLTEEQRDRLDRLRLANAEAL